MTAPIRAATLALTAIALHAQQPNHPPIEPKGTRDTAARLTDSFARERVAAAPVPRRNFIDEQIFGKIARDRIPHAPLATDAEFLRRVHLDLTGRLPTPEALRAFLADPAPDKRDKAVDSLIGSPAWRAKWTYWFGDQGRIAANRVGNDGKNLYYRWIYDNLQINRPYNEMVADLLTANAASNWFVGPASYVARWVVIGVTCEDTVHEDTADELAIRTGRHFLGVNLECVSCHDGARHTEKINLWLTSLKRKQLWEQAAFFGGTRVLRRTEVATTQDEYSIDDSGPGYNSAARSVVRIPRHGKGPVAPAFLFTGDKPDFTRPLRPQFARMLTEHPQFARATVNYIWAELMGVGIVDPPGDFDLLRQDPKAPPPAPWTVQPSHPELLEALAADFRANKYDLQRLMKQIAKSSAYQLSSRFPTEWKASYAPYFARKFVRRLAAEEVYDSIQQATNIFLDVPIRGTDRRARYSTELRSPEDLRQNRPGFKDAAFFLDVFGQTNREYSERTNDGDITQPVLLMNSPFVISRLKAAPGSALAQLKSQGIPDDEIIASLFERFLVRRPDPNELSLSRDLVKTNRDRGLEDLQWLLVNKVEFLFNY